MRLRARSPLWRNADFLLLWSGQSISQFGTQVTALALPLVAILLLDASAFELLPSVWSSFCRSCSSPSRLVSGSTGFADDQS